MNEKEEKKIEELSDDQKLAAFQGEHGAYSELAAMEFDRKAVTIRCKEFSDVFSGVESGQFDMGVVPVENSVAGSVSQVDDLLVETPLSVIGEGVVRRDVGRLPATLADGPQ